VLNKAHALTAKTRIGPSDLVGESVATYRPDTPLGRELERTLRAAGIELEIAVESTALTAAYLTDGGFGVALIDPFILAGGLFHNLTVRAFEPTTGARVQIITPKDEPLSRVCKDFLGQIRRFVPRRFSFAIPIGNG
jgi:DNA-binding transcriptional LysR family regulator